MEDCWAVTWEPWVFPLVSLHSYTESHIIISTDSILETFFSDLPFYFICMHLGFRAAVGHWAGPLQPFKPDTLVKSSVAL